MTYAGYVPAKLASVKTPLQVALAALDSEAALELLATLCRNAACAPSEPKYRKVRATNSRVAASCEACGEEAFVAAMQALGWSRTAAAVEGEEGGGEFFVLAAGKGTMAQVREIQEAMRVPDDAQPVASVPPVEPTDAFLPTVPAAISDVEKMPRN